MVERARRTVLKGLAAAGLAAALPGPVRASALPRAAVADLAERAGALDQLHALVLLRGGEEAFARAYRGRGLDRPANVKSVSKTLVAALTGIAIDRGVLGGPDQPIAPIIGADAAVNPDPRLGRVTVDHLLTMRAGLERTSGRNYGAWVQSPDWVRDALARPFVAEPGGRMLYSTGSYHLLSAVLTRASGRSLLDLARDWLGRPLGIDIPPWTRDPQGIYMGGNNMALSPRAMARFGQLYLNGGRWGGEGLISRNWVEASWRARTASPWSGHAYGYGWFIANFAGERVYYARGFGGQVIHVVPALDLVMAVSSDPTRRARSGGYIDAVHGLLRDIAIPAARAA